MPLPCDRNRPYKECNLREDTFGDVGNLSVD